jgi:hypothetical protein
MSASRNGRLTFDLLAQPKHGDKTRCLENWNTRNIGIHTLRIPPAIQIFGPVARYIILVLIFRTMYGNKYAFEYEMFGDLQIAVGKYTYDQGGYAQAKEHFELALRMYEWGCGEERDSFGGSSHHNNRDQLQHGVSKSMVGDIRKYINRQKLFSA